MVDVGLTQKEMNSTQKLDRLNELLKKEYESISIDVNDDTYFVLGNGVVFQVLYFPPFDCFTVSYANSIDDANRDFFEEGDQFDGSQDIEIIFREIQKEIAGEAA